MSHDIIKLKDIHPIEKPKFERELSQKVETCNIKRFLNGPISLELDLMKVTGFDLRLCQRENKKIWVIQEPRCKFYETFIDHKKYRDHQDGCFGRCKNMVDPRQRELYGCILSKKLGIYIPINYPDEEYVFAKMIE
ncbi:hypothetical protein J4465_02365 [Candidatus Pacearchaeota archaeon]|nr:hypothetical protein [Candidatus Pacearchaeota archaeon]